MPIPHLLNTGKRWAGLQGIKYTPAVATGRRYPLGYELIEILIIPPSKNEHLSCMKYTRLLVLGYVISSAYCFSQLNYYTVNNWVYITLELKPSFCTVSMPLKYIQENDSFGGNLKV